MGWMLSSDSHVVEPPDLWTSRAPRSSRGVVPRVERHEDGDFWCFTNERSTFGYGSQDSAGLRFEGGADALDRSATFSEVRPGGYIPDDFVKDNESDGVWGAVLYPSTGNLLGRIESGEVLALATRLYNDWISEFCRAYPDRLRGVALLCLDDVGEAVKELHRARNQLGLSVAAISVSPPPGRKYDHPEYEPLWAAAQDLDMRLSMHVGSNRVPAELAESLASRSGLANYERFVRDSIGRLIFSGVFERYPDLKVTSVEHEAGWAAWFVWRMNYAYSQMRHYGDYVKFKDGAMPGDFFSRNIFLSFQEDPVAIANREVIGVDNLMFGNDYPHGESTFPRTKEILGRLLADVPADERQKILRGNTARLYNFTVPDETAST